MTQRRFKATIIPAGGGSPVEVAVPANTQTQAKNMIAAQ